MPASGWLLGTLIGMAIAIVMIGRWISKRNVLSGRNPIALTEIYQQNMAGSGASYEAFERVLNMIGQAYHIDPRKLRPSDELQLFYNFDSWDIGAGTELLNDRVASEFGIVKFEVEPKTILELVTEINRGVIYGPPRGTTGGRSSDYKFLAFFKRLSL